MSLTVGMTYDLRSDYLKQGYSCDDVLEFDSDQTIEALEETIRSLGYKTDRIGNARSLCKRLVDGDKWDIVFNIAEGLSGRNRESQVPAILDLYGINCTFSDALICALTLDKGIAKRLVRDAGLPTAGFAVVDSLADLAKINMRYPLFAKPIAEGTGKGITDDSKIESADKLAGICADLLNRYNQPVLVEEFLPGREFTVGIIGTCAAAKVIGTMEIGMNDGRGEAIYSYDAKERCEVLVRYSPMEKGEFRRQVEELALRCYLALECRDAGRVDIRCDRAGKPNFLEINPLPGLHPFHSDLPMIATQEGMSYKQLIGSIIDSALSRQKQRV